MEQEKLNSERVEMNPDNLEQVVGSGRAIETEMDCSYCPFDYVWVGDFVGRTFECPHCHHMTLTGIKLV